MIELLLFAMICAIYAVFFKLDQILSALRGPRILDDKGNIYMPLDRK